jgi:EmrB/QacA subfamily drug resistance transporter
VLGSGLAAVDASVVNIALPAIARSLHGNLGTLQWVVTGYSLALASLLLLGGGLGDRYGRRKIFLIGVAWFLVASVLSGVAPNSSFLIAARFAQGVGSALITPSSLALLQASFVEEDRGQAIGAWSGLGALTTAAGPLLGGYLIALWSWRLVFLINVPAGLFLLLVAARHIPESRNPASGGRPDLWGALAALVLLGGLTYGLISEPTAHWSSPVVWGSLVVALAGAVALVAVERRQARPMLPLSLFAVRQFSAANAVTFVVYGALSGSFFLLPVVLQEVRHESPLVSGLAMQPATVLLLLGSPYAARLSARVGPRLPMSLGPAVAGVGLVLLAGAPTGSYVLHVLGPVIVFAVGLALTVAPLTATALGAAPAEHAGVSSAVNTVVARAAGLVAVAVLPVVAGLGGGAALAAGPLATGFHTGLWITGLLCLGGGLLAGLTIRNPRIASRDRIGRRGVGDDQVESERQ